MVEWLEAYSDTVKVQVVKTSIMAIWVVDVARKVSYKVYAGGE